jgi:hypothetical protein
MIHNGLCKPDISDNNKQMITLTVNTISGAHSTTYKVVPFYLISTHQNNHGLVSKEVLIIRCM